MRWKDFLRGLSAAALCAATAVGGEPCPAPAGPCCPAPGVPAPYAVPSAQPAPQAPDAQTPGGQASAAQPQSTDAFAQAPPAGGETVTSALPQMIGDLGFYGLGVAAAPATIPLTVRIVVPGLTVAEINQQFNLRPHFPSAGRNGAPVLRYIDPSTRQIFTLAQLLALTRPSFTARQIPAALAIPDSLSARVPVTGFGAFKICDNESPVPTDRVFATYNYFDVDRVGGNSSSLNREVIGFEKTFFDGQGSFEMRVPFTQVGDGLGGSSDLDALTMVLKYALYDDRQSGTVITGGLAVTVSTGPDVLIFGQTRTVVQGIPEPVPPGSGFPFTVATNTVSTISPTLFQPFVGYVFNFGRFYVEGFSEIVVPTDSALSTFAGNDLAVGYRLESLPVIPTFEVHANNAFNHQGSLVTPLGFVDEVVLTGGLHAPLGRSVLTLGVGTPVTGPRIFSIECVAQLNWRF